MYSRYSVFIATVLAAAAQVANVGSGKEIHAHCLRHGHDSHVKVCSALIDINPEMAESVAERLIGNNPESCSYRVMLSNIYACYGRWDDTMKLRNDRTYRKLRKMPGLSWIEGISL
ncbi:hypothetical protein FNV43_RR20248 [Rhamnella rubrinervis]|uniref:Uncharacterized protein n=1 Tax=Rhamnella rubrinervis TaxID=2594499 RepID=A0A8K0DUG8_9ROSA|nr:hypothetical protein FNV43_RR20248 [Rhamnella rubrinervis]